MANAPTSYLSGPPDKTEFLYMTGSDTTDLANLDTAAKAGWTIGPAMPRGGGPPGNNGWAVLLIGNYSV